MLSAPAKLEAAVKAALKVHVPNEVKHKPSLLKSASSPVLSTVKVAACILDVAIKKNATSTKIITITKSNYIHKYKFIHICLLGFISFLFFLIFVR